MDSHMDWQSVAISVAGAAASVCVLWFALRTLWSKPKAPPRCDNCAHFDVEEGRAVMARAPLALAAYQTITPNMAMTKRDKNGKELPLEKSLSAKDDNFNTLGACMANEQLRLGCDRCEKWKRKSA